MGEKQKKPYCQFHRTQTASKIKRSKVERNEKQINNIENGNNNKRTKRVRIYNNKH